MNSPSIASMLVAESFEILDVRASRPDNVTRENL